MNFNIVAFGSDSYKHSHHKFYPEGTEAVYSYCEPRIGARFPETCFFGLQYILARYFTGHVVTQDKIDEAAAVCEAHFGRADIFNRAGWEYILNEHQGHLPVRIAALPEGMVVPESTALFTIENTGGERTAFLTNYLETMLSQIWSPTTVATGSRAVRQIIAKYLDLTGDMAGLPFKLHDFGFRGVSSLETAALAGAAHLATGALGTDNMAAIALLRQYYSADMAGFSIPATEHSVMTAEGPTGEANIVRRVLQAHPTGLVAMVGDSYDMFRFVTDVIGGNPDILKMIREREGTVVIRPDSGDIPDIDIDVFHAIESVFGSEENAKGFRVLPDYVRMIQGDGIKWLDSMNPHNEELEAAIRAQEFERALEIKDNLIRIPDHTVGVILRAFKDEGISADNIAFGSGGGLLQDFTRDTQRFAIKCSAMKSGGEWRDVFKQPATDPTKNSKRGRLAVFRSVPGEIITGTEKQLRLLQGRTGEGSVFQNFLTTKFFNGEIMYHETLDNVRALSDLNSTGPHYALKDLITVS